MPRSVPACSKRPAGMPAIMGMLAFIMVCLLTLTSSVALAATWTGGSLTSDDWDDADNWLGNVLPVDGDTVTYDSNSVDRLTTGNNNMSLTGITIEVISGLGTPAAVTISGNAIGLAGIDTGSPRNTALTLTINNNLTLEAGGAIALSTLNAFFSSSNVNLNGSLSLGANTLNVTGSHGAYGTVSLSFNGGVNGSGGIDANGLLAIYANSALSYTGDTTLTNACPIYLGAGGSLPSSSSFNLVTGGTGGGSIWLQGRTGTVGSIQTTGGTWGTVHFDGGTLTMGGNDASTTFSGELDGPGTLIKEGTGTFTINTAAANNSLTSLTVNGGTFELGAADLLPDALTLTIGAGGTFSLNNFAETIGNFSGSGILSLGTGTLTFGNASNTSFSGNVTCTWFSGATINKQGSGSFTVPAGADITTGEPFFNINGGTFSLNRNWDIGFVDVNNGGTLAGNGSVGLAGIWVHAGGIISPGNSPGRLDSADALALDPGSTMRIELNGTNPITEYDQVLVGSGWSLAGNLSLSLGYTPAVGDSYMIIENFGGLGAPFAGLPQGGVINAGGYAFQINYLAGDGNDVVLTCLGPASGDTPTPEPEPEPNTLPAPSVSQGSGPSPAGSLDGSQLSWPHVKGASYYRIYRADCPNCKRKEIGRVRESSFIDNTAEAGRPYYYWLRTENNDGLGPYSNWLAAWRYEQNPGRAGDFNGDGIMDLLWWDPATNQLSIWFMNGGQVANVSEPGDGLDIAEWLLIALDDFNGDGACDLLWWKPETGEVKVWYLDQAQATAGGDGEWLIKNSVDFDAMTGHALIAYPGDVNGDGRADILWRDYSNGQVTVWLMGEDGKPQLSGPPTPADETITKGERPGLSGTLQWQVAGLGDADGDGKADVVWKDARNNKLVIWLMEGSNITKAIEENKGLDTVWRAVGVGDFNMDKQADIVWRNEASGAVRAWLMRAGVFNEERAIVEGSEDATQWQVKAVGDFCAPGCDDVYCKHSESSAVRINTLDGREFKPSAP